MKVTVEHKKLKTCLSLPFDDIVILRKLSGSCRISQAELLKRCLKLYMQNESSNGCVDERPTCSYNLRLAKGKLFLWLDHSEKSLLNAIRFIKSISISYIASLSINRYARAIVDAISIVACGLDLGRSKKFTSHVSGNGLVSVTLNLDPCFKVSRPMKNYLPIE